MPTNENTRVGKGEDITEVEMETERGGKKQKREREGRRSEREREGKREGEERERSRK